MSLYYQDESATLHHGDALEVASSLPDSSVDCIVTSPPYFGLRDYGVDGQYGAESTPAEFVETMRALFSELRRVLADDGTLWLNLGDSYSTGTGNRNAGLNERWGNAPGARKQEQQNQGRRPVENVPPKNLLGIPWRVALALQDDGWILRNDVIWSKPNAMPESVRDRLSIRHEHVFLFSASPTYWFDLDSIREPAATADPTDPSYRVNGKSRARRKPVAVPPGATPHALETSRRDGDTRNPGDVWTLSTQPFPGAHFAVFPPALPERCILAGCKPGGTVLDPFSGSGTTGMAAAKYGRKYVGIDINAEYLDLSLRTRLLEPSLDFGGVS